MSGAGDARIRCLVAYASAQQQYLWPVQLAPAASIAEALASARAQVGDSLGAVVIPWESAAVGIFGEARRRTDTCTDGDRIELYRPLRRDPRERRRQQVARERRAGRAPR